MNLYDKFRGDKKFPLANRADRYEALTGACFSQSHVTPCRWYDPVFSDEI
jgi:hypothetical protein